MAAKRGSRSESAPGVASPGRSRRDTIRRRLLEWYDAERRDLPWRRTRDPYRIWLSEAMLQQTRVETVVPYYERFLESFPTLSHLATADEDDVLRAWAGLGYYSRARNLKRAAEVVVADHGGHLPREEAALLALPGVGAYTAGALRSIAFDERAALVDGNVTRVLARLFALEEPRADAVWELARSLVPSRRPGDFNQALMELGATVCTPRSPTCPRCPLRRVCVGRKTGEPGRFPAPRRRTPPRPARAVCGIVERGGKVLMLRRPSDGLLGGMWELPSSEGARVEVLVETIVRRAGVKTRPGEHLGTVEHTFSHRALSLDVFRLELRDTDRSHSSATARWCTDADREGLALSRLTRKTFELAGL